MEYDLPLANLYPTTGHSAKFTVTLTGSLADITDAKKAEHKTAMATELGVHKSSILISYTSGSVIMTVEVKADTAEAASAVSNTMAGLTSAALTTALGETVTAVSEPTNTNKSSSDGMPSGAIAGIAAASIAAGLLLLTVLFMIKRETDGKPIFYAVQAKSASATSASATSATKDSSV
eukprot:2069402-Prymnesium_polylepis.1